MCVRATCHCSLTLADKRLVPRNVSLTSCPVCYAVPCAEANAEAARKVGGAIADAVALHPSAADVQKQGLFLGALLDA